MPAYTTAISIQMDGTITYADEGVINTASLAEWRLDTNNRLQIRLDTDAGTGQFEFIQIGGGVVDAVASSGDIIAPDVFVPFNISSRHGTTFLNGAVDGTALTADLTPTSLPDLSATDFRITPKFNGNVGKLVVWSDDIGDVGIAEATT